MQINCKSKQSGQKPKPKQLNQYRNETPIWLKGINQAWSPLQIFSRAPKFVMFLISPAIGTSVRKWKCLLKNFHFYINFSEQRRQQQKVAAATPAGTSWWHLLFNFSEGDGWPHPVACHWEPPPFTDQYIYVPYSCLTRAVCPLEATRRPVSAQCQREAIFSGTSQMPPLRRVFI